MQINGATRLFGILGHPVTHSLSPAMHNAALENMGINGVYVPMDVTDLEAGVAGLRALGFVGLSVTIPHKEDIMRHLDEIDPVARRIGAVNTLHFRQHPDSGERILRGFNTDWLGSNLALAEAMSLPDSRVLVLGAGGAAKGVCFGLVEAGARVFVSNRSHERGQALADWLGCEFVPSDAISEIKAHALVNTTSVGMEPDVNGIPVDPALLPRFSVVMDIVYAPLETRLLREARAAGCVVVDGLAMLLNQAAVQLKIWTGAKPPLLVMRQALVSALRG